MKTCSVEGCTNKHYGKGYCEKHYTQMRRYGKISRSRFDSNEIIEYVDHAEIVLYNKQCEEVARAIIDLECINIVKQYKWHLRDNGYVSTPDNIYLHRLIAGTNDNSVIDHINRNKLDNRRENLRHCTQQENTWNSKTMSNNTSGYTGVYKRNNKWCARIVVNKKQINLGTFATFEEAVDARKKAEEEYFIFK